MALLTNKIRKVFNSKKQTSPSSSSAVLGDESIMRQKKHGTSNVPVQANLRWKCDRDKADKICNYNRHYAEHSWYYRTRNEFMNDTKNLNKMTFYDSNTGKPLFSIGGDPAKRSIKDFLRESAFHGWPSFRDDEVNWENVRVLKNGETVSVDGTHLGHNLPDKKGSRYCINLVSVAGHPVNE